MYLKIIEVKTQEAEEVYLTVFLFTFIPAIVARFDLLLIQIAVSDQTLCYMMYHVTRLLKSYLI